MVHSEDGFGVNYPITIKEPQNGIVLAIIQFSTVHQGTQCCIEKMVLGYLRL